MKRRGEGLLALDPRTQMGLVITTTLVAFVPKPFWLEAATVVWLALLQALCGHPWMAVGYLAGFAAVIWLLDYAFAFEAAAFLGMFAFCFTLWRRTFAVVMAASLLARENSVHRIVAAKPCWFPLRRGFAIFPRFDRRQAISVTPCVSGMFLCLRRQRHLWCRS